MEAEHIAHMLKKAGRMSRRRSTDTAEASTLGKLVTWPRDGGMWACNCCRGRCNNLSEVGSSRQRQQQQQRSEQLESRDKNLKENYENCAQLTQFPLHFSTTCNYFFLRGTASYSCLSHPCAGQLLSGLSVLSVLPVCAL